MSFRLSDTKDTSDSQSTTMVAMLAELQEEEPPEEYEQSLELDFESETDASATRIGYYTLVFHASRGVSTPAAAGVKWSFTEGYADAIDLEVDDVQVVDYSSEEYDPNFHLGDEVYPSDYQGQMSSITNATVGISASGTNVFSSAPSINSSSEVERAVTASVSYNNSGNLSSTNSLHSLYLVLVRLPGWYQDHDEFDLRDRFDPSSHSGQRFGGIHHEFHQCLLRGSGNGHRSRWKPLGRSNAEEPT